MKKRKMIEINEDLCNGCGQCASACAEGAIQIVDGKARLAKNRFCDGLGACIGECPAGALKIVEREAEGFDAEAVHDRPKSACKTDSLPVRDAGCPSMVVEEFVLSPHKDQKTAAADHSSPSALSHWPVQIRLVPPAAPFLKNADLLVAADCVPFAYADFHRDFLQDKILMIGCPKFDDKKEYLERFIDIFRLNNIKSVTVLDMEVPCCSSLPRIVGEAMNRSGRKIPLKEVIVTQQGGIKSIAQTSFLQIQDMESMGSTEGWDTILTNGHSRLARGRDSSIF
jgi:ferredoxin